MSFLKELKVQHTNDQHRAVTWMELYIMYRLKGHVKPIKDNPNKARSRATVSMQLNNFKACIRGIIKRFAADEESKSLFSLVKLTKEKFLGLGISGKHAAPSIMVNI